jgi:anti-sigma regulatory factor (Ser/Thr protein kinase)
MTSTTDGRGRLRTFEHEALIFHGTDDLIGGVVPFLAEGLESGDPMLVATPSDHLAAIRDGLGPVDISRVTFLDMKEIGGNPARIIPIWEDFVTRWSGAGLTPRGIAEPVWPGRSDEELVECQHHEALINVAFAGQEPWRLVCPYDADALPPAVVTAAQHTHPLLTDRGRRQVNHSWPGLAAMAAPSTDALSAAPGTALTLSFSAADLREVRRVVADVAISGGLTSTRAEDLALAVHEMAANSIRHGGGSGLLRTWVDDGTALAEVSDAGQIDDALVGRRQPDPERVGGRGVWMAHQLCDLVQVRRTPTGTTVRLHQRRS